MYTMTVAPFETGGKRINVAQIMHKNSDKGVLVWLHSLNEYDDSHSQKVHDVFLKRYVEMLINNANVEYWSIKDFQKKLDNVENRIEHILCN